MDTATASQIVTDRTRVTSRRRFASPSAGTDVRPTSAPASLNTGPPALPNDSRRSVSIARGFRAVTSPHTMSACARSGAAMVTISSPSSIDSDAVGGHIRGSGCRPATTPGSIHTIATSRETSDDSTRADTLTVGDSCTSTDVARPTTFRSVATNPCASTMKPEPRDVGDQIATTLSCHFPNSNEGSRADAAPPAAADADSVNGTTSAFSAVRARVASRPATRSTICVHS